MSDERHTRPGKNDTPGRHHVQEQLATGRLEEYVPFARRVI